MSRAIAIHLGEDGRPIGTLRHDQQGARESSAFQYGDGWIASADRFTIDPALPLVSGPQYHRRLRDGSAFHSAIADTAPDGWGKQVILRDHAKRRLEARRTGQEVSAAALNGLDFLLAVDDVARVGALRFRDESGRYQNASEDGRQTTPPLMELADLLAATRAVETHSETAADLAYLRGRGTSLGGLRPKCSVREEDGSLAIGKFPSVADERAVTKGEVLALVLAQHAGINAAAARLVDSDGAPVALIRRFDRTPKGERIMYVSAATMIGAERTEPGQHTYTELVDALRQHGAQAAADIEELWRRIAFSILITNTDDHLMNHGFLHVRHGQWRLSPAFDINPFPDRLRELKTWVSEDTGPEASIEALMSVTPYFRISRERARTILREVEGAVARWRQTGRALGMSSVELDAFADAFEHEERSAAQAICA